MERQHIASNTTCAEQGSSPTTMMMMIMMDVVYRFSLVTHPLFNDPTQ
jgi:hypothetical protein